jgi:hypothetical protein
MAISKQVMHDIRMRRATQELDAALKVSEAVAHQLLQVSGVRERVNNSVALKIVPEHRETLLKLARQIESEEAMLETEKSKRQPSRKEV